MCWKGDGWNESVAERKLSGISNEKVECGWSQSALWLKVMFYLLFFYFLFTLACQSRLLPSRVTGPARCFFPLRSFIFPLSHCHFSLTLEGSAGFLPDWARLGDAFNCDLNIHRSRILLQVRCHLASPFFKGSLMWATQLLDSYFFKKWVNACSRN